MSGPPLAAPRVLGSGWMLAVLGLALLVRAAAVGAAWHDPLDGDALFYSAQASTIADGDGFRDPFADLRPGAPDAAAPHPPLFPAYLAVWSALGADSQGWHRIATIVLGLGTTLLVAELGTRLAGRRGGIVAGLAAAVWPDLWYFESDVQAEAIAALAVGGFAVLGLAYLRRPTLGRLAAVGVAAGLAALGRAELILLVGVVPLLVVARAGMDLRRRIGWTAVGGAAALAVVAPWSAYNQARFDEPVALSTGLGLVLVSSNCDPTYYGDTIGYWQFPCSVQGANAAGTLLTDDDSTRDLRMRRVAIDHATENAGRLPAVATARGVRYLGLWPPGSAADLATAYEDMPRWVYLAAQASWLAALGFSAVAVRRAWSLGHRVAPLLAPPLVGLATAILIYGIVRFRAPIEPPVVALGAAGAVLLWERRWGPAPPRPDEEAAPAPVPLDSRVVRRRPGPLTPR